MGWSGSFVSKMCKKSLKNRVLMYLLVNLEGEE